MKLAMTALGVVLILVSVLAWRRMRDHESARARFVPTQVLITSATKRHVHEYTMWVLHGRHRTATGEHEATSIDAYDDEVREMVGTQVAATVDPKDPQRFALVGRGETSTGTRALFTVPFLIIGIGLIAVAQLLL